jgi:hypothetical protein|tara:strand:+ start:326 stop:1525 length:1200 start_codon:yes stop_codon:yes gene_type:complete
MSTSAGPNISLDGLVFGYDTGYPIVDNDNSSRFSKGETTENLIYDMSGTVTSAYPEVVYRSTANETNVVDTSVPGGKYSRFNGIDGSSNNQLYSRFSSYSIDVRGDSVNYSVYLKGSGTCHLTIYDNQTGYGTSSTITLTDEWVRYNYTKTISSTATSYWVAVRGVLNTTDVYIAGQQATRGTHSTPYVEDNRSSTQSIIDLKETTEIDLTNVSFDSNAQLTFDGTDDGINLGDNEIFDFTNGVATIEAIVKFPSSWTGGSQYPNLISKGGSAGWDTDGWALYGFRDWPNSGQKSWGFAMRNGSTVRNTSRSNITVDEYLHIVITIDGTTIRLYENGVQVTTNSQTINPASNSTNVYLGRGPSSQFFPGELPISKVYNITLSADEIKQNFNAYKKRFGI